jgi:hypothetical protein
MEKHMYILKQLLIYYCEQQGFFNTVNNIKEGNDFGEMSIRAHINDYLK